MSELPLPFEVKPRCGQCPLIDYCQIQREEFLKDVTITLSPSQIEAAKEYPTYAPVLAEIATVKALRGMGLATETARIAVSKCETGVIEIGKPALSDLAIQSGHGFSRVIVQCGAPEIGEEYTKEVMLEPRHISTLDS